MSLHVSPLVRYRLLAVVVHGGQAGGGHYICYTRAGDDGWLCCDDGRVPTPCQPTIVTHAQAYILFYKRQARVILARNRWHPFMHATLVPISNVDCFLPSVF